MRRLAGIALALGLALAACNRPPEASPALWEVTGKDGAKGWLFGTIHQLETPVTWRKGPVATAFDRADLIVTELGVDEDPASNGRVLMELSQTPDLPPALSRVPIEWRPKFERLVRKAGSSPDRLASTETWAIALVLAKSGSPAGGAENGIDRAVIDARGARRVEALEGAVVQLSLFDRLPETEQRDLLVLAIRDADKGEAEGRRLARAWAAGDMATIETATHQGILADAELREVLFTGRNRAWTDRIAALLGQGRNPFVAVGAAHMAGPEGLPTMLAARGYTVRRVQ